MILGKEAFLEKKLKDPHVIILGDNQIVLKDLKSIYEHKVGLIYINPPYNRGNDLSLIHNYEEFKKVIDEIRMQISILKQRLDEFEEN